MAEIDVSSYKQAQPPPRTALDTLNQVQHLESNRLTIQKQQLDQINQGYGYLIRELNSLPPDATAQQMHEYATRMVKMKLSTPEQAAQVMSEVPLTATPEQVKRVRESLASRFATNQEAINFQFGMPPQFHQLPAGVQAGQGSQRTGRITPTGGNIPPQLPVNQPEVNQDVNSLGYGQPGVRGVVPPQVPQGMEQAPGGFAGEIRPASRLPIQPMQPQNATPMRPTPIPTTREPPVRPRLPVASPMVPAAPSVVPPMAPGAGSGATPDQRGMASSNVGGFTPTGLPPGIVEARRATTQAGGTNLVEDRNAATTKLQGIIPLRQALQLLPMISTGIGTDTYNKARAALINLGVIAPNQNDPTVIYQEVNKMLSRYVGSSTLANRSDAGQILAQNSNPNVATQLNPALMKVAREAVALDRIEAARALSYGNKPPEEYGAYRASFPQTVDERAFSIDLLPNEDRAALIEKMRTYRNGTAAQKREEAKFRRSLEMADSLGLINIPE